MVFASPTEVPVNACETASGRYVDAVNPEPADITITDISWSLARQARFAGHTLSDEVWSVGQHSIFVTELIEMAIEGIPNFRTSLRKWMDMKGLTEKFPTFLDDIIAGYVDKNRVLLGALMHDASEAYLVDLPSPVKRHQLLREPYKALEINMMKAIHQAFDMPALTDYEEEMIVWADMLALRIEAAVMMPSRGRGWNGTFPEMSLADLHVFPQVTRWRVTHLNFIKEFMQLRRQ